MKTQMINSIDELLSKLPTSSFSTRNLALITLLVLGILGNYCHLPLLFGVDFLFGSIAVLIVIELYGTLWGILAATIASSYTFLFWEHPYAIIIFTCEAVFVSLLKKRQKYSLLVLDEIYWLCIGMPLIFLFYGVAMQMGTSQVLLILFKQPINGIFNALVASLLLTYVPIFRTVGGSKFAREFSLKKNLVNLLVAFVFCSSLIVMNIDNQSFVKNTQEYINAELKTLSSTEAKIIYSWDQTYEKGIEKISQIAIESNFQPSKKLQSTLKTLSDTLPGLDYVSVTGADGSKVATYFESLAVSQADNLTSCNGEFQTAASAEFLEINEPVLQENNFLGCLQVKINLNSLDKLLELGSFSIIENRSESSLPLELTLIDSSNLAIATSLERLEFNSKDKQALPGKSNPFNLTILQRHPLDKKHPSIPAWQQSLYQQKTQLGKKYLPWSLVIKLQAAPANYLNGIYIRPLGTLLFISFLATAIATILSKKLLEPIEKLTVAPQELPDRLLKGVEFEMPKNLAFELKGLVANFQFLADYNQDNCKQLKEVNRQLSKEKFKRKKEQNRVQKLNKNLEIQVKERTAKIEISLAQLKGLIQNIQAGILVENESGYITLVNQELCKILPMPCSPEALIGMPWADAAIKTKEIFLNPDEFIARITDNLQQKTVAVNEELQLRDGRTLELDYIPITISGKFYGNLWIYRDISDRKQAEREIQRTLTREIELKSYLISMTSHEFRSPLAVISSSAGILRTFPEKLSEEKKVEHLHTIEKYVQHAAQLLDEILLINQAEAGKLQFKPKLIDLVSFCQNLASEMQLAASDHSIVFTHHCTADTTVAEVDEKLLRHVLNNLLSNGIKYSPHGGEVNFTIALTKDLSIFQVKDSGIGIPPEDQKSLFETFHRAQNVGTIQGSGLGLSIVKKCVELHGGNVKVESEVGRGTTFTVTLPLSPTTTEAMEG